MSKIGLNFNKKKAVLTKRQENRQKLSSIEWTDEDIADTSDFNPSLVSNISQNDKNISPEEDVTSMESKIARVQKRKEETMKRLERLSRNQEMEALIFNSLNKMSLLSEKLTKKFNTDFIQILYKKPDLKLIHEICESLNEYFNEFLSLHPELINPFVVAFSWNFFDSNLFDELLLSTKFKSKAKSKMIEEPITNLGCCIISANSVGLASSTTSTPIGTFLPCEILEIVNDKIKIDIPGSLKNSIHFLDRCHVYFFGQDIDVFVRRIINNLYHRYQSVSLMRLNTMISSMPIDEKIISSISNEVCDRIFEKSSFEIKIKKKSEDKDFNSKRNYENDKESAKEKEDALKKEEVNKEMILRIKESLKNLAIAEISDAKGDYEFIMNKILFFYTIINKKNKKLFNNLLLFPTIFEPSKPVPYYGIVKVPSYNYNSRLSFHKNSSFLSSLAAVKTLQIILNYAELKQDTKIVDIKYQKSFTIEKFERFISEQFVTASRVIKQEWIIKMSQNIREAILKTQENLNQNNFSGLIYDINIRNIYEYDKPTNYVKNFLDRLNFMISDLLKLIIKKNLINYSTTINNLCSCNIEVHDIKNINVSIPENSLYRLKSLPPLFTLAFRISAEEKVLNQEIINENNQKISAWMQSKEAETGAKCPIPRIEPIIGKYFEYNHSLNDFKDLIVKTFHNIYKEFLDVPHIQKYIMEKIYFPNPKIVESITSDLEIVKEQLDLVNTAMDRAIDPLKKYLSFFSKYEDFINIKNDIYVNYTIKVQYKDSDNHEIEIPLTVNLNDVKKLLTQHFNEIKEIEDSLPIHPIECGLFLIDISSVRNLLLEKHRAIIKFILSSHSERCLQISSYLEDEFKKINKVLSKRPETIEQLVEQEEYIASLPVTLSTLQGCIKEMMDYYDLLDEFRYKSETDSGFQKWQVFESPAKIISKCSEVKESNVAIRRRLQDEMLGEQSLFAKTLNILEGEVSGLDALIDLNDVVNIAAKVSEVESKLAVAQSKVRLYNSRENLFEQEITDYEQVNKIARSFEPYANLWLTAKDWGELSQKWFRSRFVDINPDEVEQQAEKFNSAINKAAKYFARVDLKHQSDIANAIKAQVSEFMPQVPMIVTLRNPGMRDRHWEQISTALNINITNIEDFTTEQIIGMNLTDSFELVQRIGESAAKEYQIEKALDKMEKEWDNMNLNIVTYKETGTGILKGIDEINAILDEQITMTQTIMFSAFKGPFEERIDEWNRKLCCISDLLEVWVTVQRNWLYLQPIFESADINRQLPTEGKKFSTVDKSWRQTIAAAKIKPSVLEFCDNPKLLERFKDCEILLDQVQKGLSDYLETKRSVFARFYFLSNDELLSILSESKDVKLVQPHLKKCFEGIDRVNFLPDLTIDKMISPENEEVPLFAKIDPNDKNVENWMLELEYMMRVSVRDTMYRAILDYTQTPRAIWMQKWIGMCVLNGSQLHWTREMEELFNSDGENGPEIMYKRQLAQLAEMTILVRGKLSKSARTTIGALTVIDVHARDVIYKLVDEKVSSKDNFSWTSQLRYYWKDDDLCAQMVAAIRPYGYEYLGNSFRLVITPLTDKCYLTLMGALQMIFGGAPAGPAGTGKTETTKDLAKALAMQCVVFNCSDGLDYIAMGKFFKGLSACGAWACFDEFNRINIEVLSVIGQQIMSIQMAIRAKQQRIFFEGSDILVSDRFAVFITMNPGYAGRSALPDSLQALFRPVAMMVPDYALIGEIMFFAYGFEFAKECGAKMVTTFKLCSEQLSSQPHYDYGMRAVKTVITAAGNLKQQEPDADEMVLLLRALRDVNYPKFLEMDLPLFEGIISDLFPGKQCPDPDYGALMRTMKEEIHKFGLQPVKFFVSKVIQLYEMIVVRHGLMLVGPTGGGKSSNLHVLEHTLTSLKNQNIKGFAYEHVKIFQLNPKSITMGQMYGEFDPNTLEWKDGIMSTMYRIATNDTSPDRKWIMFDGPVDAIWIENMNTVLDDNKKLCLNSGEIIKMSNEMTMMFEVEDLAVASPATVSRVGIIYMEPKGLGVDVLLQSWLERMPPCTSDIVKNKLIYYFDIYVPPSIAFLRTNLKELSPTVDNNLVESLLRIIDCYLVPYYPREGSPPPTDLMVSDLVTCIDALFLFALTWSVCSTCNEDGRKLFDSFIRSEIKANKFPWPFPKQGMIYDYLFLIESKKWVRWMEVIDKFDVDNKLSFSEIIVPTTDSVRNTFLLDLLLSANKHVLMVGATGTGKTININQYLSGSSKVCNKTIGSHVIPLTMTFSANTSANLTQDLLDSKMDKRRKGVFGPAAGKKFYIYVDDLNMPKREEYGAQPPIELLRQWFDQGGWYDRKDLSFRKIIDLVFVASMGPPGGGRQEITARFLRHFNTIGYVEMSDSSKSLIFGTILRNFLLGADSASLAMLTDTIVQSSIEVFSTICRDLLPTPSKSHYTFNLRDLAKIFQGMLMVEAKSLSQPVQVARLWVHETLRVFADRLTCEEDTVWLHDILKEKIESKFQLDFKNVMPNDRLLYGDFMDLTTDARIYREIESIQNLKTVIEEYLQNHNSESKQPMPLVMFNDALEHVTRIARILRQPQGNALLLGVGGSGRQSMTKLATYIMGYNLSMVEIVKGYSLNDWREDIKQILLKAGVKNQQTTFLFSDVQIIDERMVEDINNILNSGDVPNLYAAEDLESIASVFRIECQKKKIPPTKLNIFNQYLVRVRKNIHLCIAMSPLGEAFRNRLRNFPSLVNCCTIDWFTNWPAEALQSVGISVLQNGSEDLGMYTQNAVSMFKSIHMSVEQASKSYYEVLRRHNYVTPTSYLELLSSFSKLMKIKRQEILTKKNRLQIGLDKLTDTKAMVSVMQEELVLLQPQLVKTGEEVSKMMVEITRDKASAAETKAEVEIEEGKANEKAAAAKAIADDAQRDLDEATPALEEAVKCLNDLKKSDIDEVKSLKTPPSGVVLTIKVCCIIFDVKPIKKNDPNNPGKKIDDYWEAAQKTLLADAKAFQNSLLEFDKDNIQDKTIKAITPYIEDPGFTKAAIERSSKACTAICMWAHAMYKYHFVALAVAPKRARLKEAEDELKIVMDQLATAKAKLKSVNDKLEHLESQFNAAVEKKAELEKKEISCKIQLSNADKLIGGLGGEEKRWTDTVDSLKVLYENVLGDVIISAATISYLGVFTSDFRQQLVNSWQENLLLYKIPHSTGCTLDSTLSDPVKIRQWQICNLPSDSLSTQNAIIMDNARRWPLLIDPQGQGNRYIRSMAKDTSLGFCLNGMDVVKLSDKNFLRTLENGVQFGRWVLLENIHESLDAALEPVLLQQKFKQGGQDSIKIGDNIIPYNDSFRFFMTTKLANPHYPPEVQVKVSLLNFTITITGLEEQLLNVVVSEELPELASQKANLVVQNASMNKQLYDIESEILYLLSNSKGNILDDTVLIETLAQSKLTSEDIKVKMKEASVIEQEISVQSELYRPVAKRASLLYFVVADLGYVDLMYQYSLQWFTNLFVRAIANSSPSNSVEQRIINLNDFFTLSIYNNVCRSLFERHKLLFSFILTIKILQGEDLIDPLQYRFLLSGISPDTTQAPMPQTNWLELNVWNEICSLNGVCPKDSTFNTSGDMTKTKSTNTLSHIIDSFNKHTKEWQIIFESNDPHTCKFPEPFEIITPLERLCILRCLRRDKMELAMQDFIIQYLGDRFIQPPPFDLRACYMDSHALSPLIFILSSGSDPNKDLDILAQEMNMTDKLKRIALGQGQGKKAAQLIEYGAANGEWVMLQNCHLSSSWMPILEQIVEALEGEEKLNPEFRLWLTSMPSESFPPSLLQNGVKITKEPPKGLKANLKSTYIKLDNNDLKKTNKTTEFQKLLFGLSFYHALVIERKKFGPLGWNIPYEFNDTDMDITAAQLELYVNSYEEIPYKVLQQLTSVVNYGGRITDDKDMRTSDIIIADFFTPNILEDNYKFSSSGIYHSITPDKDAPHQSYMEYIESLPYNADPEVFGMHPNASITCAITEADNTFGIILTLQPRVSGISGGISREDQIIDMAHSMQLQLPPLFDIDFIVLTYPTNYHESMNTVLVQEAQRYNKLLGDIHVSIREVQRALKGLVVLSSELEAMSDAIYDQRVPLIWTKVSYPSLKPLNPWFKDFLKRLQFIGDWINNGLPPVYWISGFFFPQGFLTAILQNYARKYRYPIDTVSFSFVMSDQSLDSVSRPPIDGSFIYGLYIEGARWDKDEKSLVDPKPKELFSQMPIIHMLPEQYRKTPQEGIYRCPIYKILTRTGTLSTTGHSTNFVTWIEIPSNKETIFRSSLVSETNAQVKFCDQDYWIKAGVACFCALKY